MNYNWRLSEAEPFNLREAVQERPKLGVTARLTFRSALLSRCEETRCSVFHVLTLLPLAPPSLLIPVTSHVHGVIPV